METTTQTQPDFANEFLARVYLPLIETGTITMPEIYTCSRIETCRLAREDPLQPAYRCHNKLLASICPRDNGNGGQV